MARLVKSRLEPCKMVLKKSLMINKCNRIISLREAVERDTLVASLEHEMASAQTMLKQFCKERASIIEKSMERGRHRLLRKIIGDVLALVHQYKQQQDRESMAMETLAHRIAANIANITDFPERKAAAITNHHLIKSGVHIKILLPEDFIRVSEHAITLVAEHFGDLVEVAPWEDLSLAKLELTMAEQRLSLLSDAKIMANAVSSWIMRTTRA